MCSINNVLNIQLIEFYVLIDKRKPITRMGYLEFVVNANWQSSKNYINRKLLNSEETTKLTKSVELNYKAAYIPYDENGDIKI